MREEQLEQMQECASRAETALQTAEQISERKGGRGRRRARAKGSGGSGRGRRGGGAVGVGRKNQQGEKSKIC
jgi:hypothetical protein